MSEGLPLYAKEAVALAAIDCDDVTTLASYYPQLTPKLQDNVLSEVISHRRKNCLRYLVEVVQISLDVHQLLTKAVLGHRFDSENMSYDIIHLLLKSGIRIVDKGLHAYSPLDCLFEMTRDTEKIGRLLLQYDCPFEFSPHITYPLWFPLAYVEVRAKKRCAHVMFFMKRIFPSHVIHRFVADYLFPMMMDNEKRMWIETASTYDSAPRPFRSKVENWRFFFNPFEEKTI